MKPFLLSRARKGLLLLLLWQGALACAQKATSPIFTQDTISDALMTRMRKGNTWKTSTPVSLRQELRYLRMSYKDANGQTRRGEMVVNRQIADRVLRIFRKLYEAGYRIEKMKLMDDYQGDDEASMQDNNTSCFNFRYITNSTTAISKHGYGLAIDLNPLYNPYVKGRNVAPVAGKPYAFRRDSRKDIPYKIDRKDLAYRLFTAEGFRWGGDWKSQKDYQHFEFSIPK